MNKKAHKIIIVLSAGLTIGIVISFIVYYADLISKGFYELNSNSIYNIVTGLLLSSAPLLSIIVGNPVVIHINNPKSISNVSAVTLLFYLIFLLIDLGKDFAFFYIGALNMSEEIFMLAIVLFFWHLMSVVPMIMTLAYCKKTKKEMNERSKYENA
jgi:hypothetical protein